MFGHSFYHGTLRRYVTVFGTLFNEILISRENNSSVTKKQFRVPIAYGPMQKFLARLEGDSSLTNAAAISLPRISFEMTNVSYDPERRLTGRIRNTKSVSANNQILTTQFAPAPYNMDFTLSIMAKYSEDGTKILEQILPFFKPEWTASVKLVDALDEYFDIPTIMNSVSSEEVYDGDFNTRRVVIWTLTFTMKGYFFGPVTTKKIIKFANVNFYSQFANGDYSNSSMQSVKVYPGLLANGDPAGFVSSQTVRATANAQITGDSVSSFEVITNGIGYNSATVTIAAPDSGSNTATASANVVNDGVRELTITSAGSGYASSPTVTISVPDNESVAHTEINKDDNWAYVVIIEDS
jgi:hypothetical protein